MQEKGKFLYSYIMILLTNLHCTAMQCRILLRAVQCNADRYTALSALLNTLDVRECSSCGETK